MTEGMPSIKTFFKVLFRSSTSAVYYLSVITAPLSFSLKFFISGCILYALIFALYFNTKYLLPLKQNLETITPQISLLYPADLEIKLTNGKVSLNSKGKFSLPMAEVTALFRPQAKHFNKINISEPQSILTIDPQALPEDFFGYSTYILVTQDSLVYKSDSGSPQSVPLHGIKDMVINQNQINSSIQTFKDFLTFIWPIFTVFITASALILISVILFSLSLIYAFIGLIMARLLELTLCYHQVLKISLHLMVPILFFTGLIYLLGLSLIIPYSNTALYLVSCLIILLTLKEST